MRFAAACLLFALPVFAAEPPKVDPKSDTAIKITPGKPVTVVVGKKCILTVETTAVKVTWRAPVDVDAVPIDGKRLAVWATEGTYILLAQVPSGDDVLSTEVVLTVTGPRPPPQPPQPPAPPTPTPPQPTPPAPVTSFHVIFIVETANTIPADQLAVMDAKTVRDWLTANTTPESGIAGWRRKDKDSGAANDTTTMRALWDAVKPKVTSTPCVAVEANGKVEIVPIAATPDAMLAVFKKHKGVP